MNPQVLDAATLMNIPHQEVTQLVAPQRVVEQDRQDRAVALGFERLPLRRVEQPARLGVGYGRRLALVAINLRPGHAFDRVDRHGVPFAQVFEERGQRSELAADGGALQLAAQQFVAIGNHMSPDHGAEFLGPGDPDETHEVADIDAVDPAGSGARDVRKPLGFRRDIAKLAELLGAQQSAFDATGRRQLRLLNH